MSNAHPKQLQKSDTEFKIVWQDGHESAFSFRSLRQECPCAVCRDEWTGKPLLDPESVPKDLGVKKAELVGNYAVAFLFSDGHSTGIYSFQALRGLCPCTTCKTRPK
ncbi:MAG: DUF971 domain-containing protein [Elusimicrobia bacterium]|nr:DUF971 domain-containing protein [Elusimicrobiota bacterium]